MFWLKYIKEVITFEIISQINIHILESNQNCVTYQKKPDSSLWIIHGCNKYKLLCQKPCWNELVKRKWNDYYFCINMNLFYLWPLFFASIIRIWRIEFGISYFIFINLDLFGNGCISKKKMKCGTTRLCNNAL